MTDGKDPLAALEELLGDKGKGAGNPGSADDKAKAEAEKALKEKQEEEQKMAEVKALGDEQKVEDAESLRQGIADLQQVHQMPEEQARKQQVEDKQQATEDRQTATDEYEIRQLGHTKI